MIEKAIAKLHGNFAHIIGGLPNEAISVLNGAPGIEMLHSGHSSNEDSADPLYSAQQVFEKLLHCDTKRAIMTSGSPNYPNEEEYELL